MSMRVIWHSLRHRPGRWAAGAAALALTVVIPTALVMLISTASEHRDHPWEHGARLAVAARQEGAANARAVCQATLITGSFSPPWGSDPVYGNVPPPSDPQGRASWLAGCLHGFAVTRGYSEIAP